MAAPFYDQGQPRMWHLLAVVSWSQWLTWLFQVMPVFFFVGGFANLTSWEAHQRRGQGYATWLAVHQMGYAWHAGRLVSSAKMAVMSFCGLGLLMGLVYWGPYPLSMVGVPTDTISNTLPPKWLLLALGLTQIGLLLSLQSPVRRWLNRPVPWTGTILINGMIMTVFLWHSTAMVSGIGLVFLVEPVAFAVTPGVAHWWALRPLWVALFAATTLPFLMVFSRFERDNAQAARATTGIARLYLGCVLTCGGLGYLALKGIGGSPHWFFDAVALLVPFMGCATIGCGPLARRIR